MVTWHISGRVPGTHYSKLMGTYTPVAPNLTEVLGSLTLPSCTEAFFPIPSAAPRHHLFTPPSSSTKSKNVWKVSTLPTRSLRPLFLLQRRPIYVTFSTQALATCMPTYFCRHDSSSSNLVATLLQNHIKGNLER